VAQDIQGIHLSIRVTVAVCFHVSQLLSVNSKSNVQFVLNVLNHVFIVGIFVSHVAVAKTFQLVQ
jgi:hypothetical protein